MSRKTTPDILGELMGAIKPESNKAINAFDQDDQKEKATFNLTKKTLLELEECWTEIRKIRKDKRVSKTDIVEYAIKEAICEFVKKKQESNIYCTLESNKTIKQ